jgi:hypothetical protein
MAVAIKQPKLSFKKQPGAKGLSSVGNPHQDVTILLDKKQIGVIYGPTWRDKDSKWSIQLMVKHANSWKNILLKAKFDTEEHARQFMINNIGRILQKYEIHYLEN